ncbi:MAG: ABC transporter ATP-binding protein [Limnochordaceae bacterium]|nr:ABC transporter ATP-binding protein [Limnochordaceae bacterium]
MKQKYLDSLSETYRKFGQFFSNTIFIYKQVLARAPKEALLIVVVALFRGFQGLMQIYLTKLVIDAVMLLGSRGPGSVSLLTIVLLQSLLVIGNRLTHPIEALAQGRAGLELSRGLTKDIMRKAADEPYEMYDQASHYDVIDRAKRETGSNPVDMLLYSMWFLQACIGFVSMAATVAAFHFGAAMLVVATSLPGIAFQYSVSHRSWRVMNSTTPDVRRLNYLRDLLTERGAAKEVRVFGLKEWILDRYDAIFQKYALEFLATLSGNTRMNLLMSLISGCGMAVVQLAIVLAAARHEITTGDMTFYFQGVTGTFSSLQALTSYIGGVMQRSMFASNVVTFLNVGNRQPLDRRVQTVVPSDRTDIVVEFDHVTFAYPGRSVPVLRDVSLQIGRGERVAIVGPNGAGKSSLLKLMLGLYSPVQGSVRIEGVDTRDWDPELLWRRFGVCLQDYVRFGFMVREVIGIGDLRSIDDMTKVERAALRAGVHSFISDLAAQWDTYCGKEYDANGNELSVGQWQRLSLARAMMRECEIMVFDEPAASLDIDAEVELFKSLNDVGNRKTLVYVSHRLETVVSAGRIILVQQGRIIEDGSHEDLMRRSGEYYRMYHLHLSRLGPGKDSDAVVG